ncbi:N-acyl homoserine lactonase family protein [Dermatobacter hominis]|uniref:N-acyl homoserine lactonase family protein n=1 Tax=Dermatobacter hominis TaxID=2884263 RepID=UPI001D117ABA|nr:N-acyl homoserine lactonase family protein [Dermatobacter hominis]UDY36114.1 N-acyl homoserine lactonase family protein [Dermatobacter hominis]
MTARLRAFTTGWLTTERAGLIEGGEGPARIPVVSYLVEHARGTLLFDTGLHPDVRVDVHARIGGLADFFTTELPAGTSVDERSAELTSRVDLVACSHLHFDHCGGNGLLGDVPVLVQRAEWDAAHGGDPTAGYLAHDFDTGQDVRLLDGDHDVFGDGTVVCIPTPGHTAGHQSLRVRTDDAEVVLTGDACYFRESLDTGRLPLFGFDPEQQHRSLDLLRSMEASGSQLVFGHDAEQIPDDEVRSF